MKSAFEYQLEMLKIELEQIDSGIRQMDDMSKSIKDWAIVTWSLSLGAVLATDVLKPFIGLTASIPFVFWLVDARYGQMQTGFFFRRNQISKFLNDKRLKQSFDEKKLVNFKVFDNRNIVLRFSKCLRYSSTLFLYIGLMMISLVVHLILILKI